MGSQNTPKTDSKKSSRRSATTSRKSVTTQRLSLLFQSQDGTETTWSKPLKTWPGTKVGPRKPKKAVKVPVNSLRSSRRYHPTKSTNRQSPPTPTSGRLQDRWYWYCASRPSRNRNHQSRYGLHLRSSQRHHRSQIRRDAPPNPCRRCSR